ncbi:hypothetical protein SYNPS1DRAFT_28004 [Syncephalis pseudoplumigaleata]|uniref:Uncharacterized protein n=1 Tax=Syncephalis pseudoplumigaleata TaxID=1712513 RepID=A0A4P9Z2V5_9FUNG|nr:hypothetical protein SYNPS1DRAFT_28004 [Syncephalis pseudoplumigaleata]|eukprot:RKP26302.1 hypothetical protein SYNPS1DRAFT_28004 [Syncephalis pseudoplumigaleata]
MLPEHVDETARKAILEVVKQITRAGENEPNPQHLKVGSLCCCCCCCTYTCLCGGRCRQTFKAFCKRSNAHTAAAYEAVFAQLRTRHAQLTVGVHNERLPPPKEHANRMRSLMLKSLRDWHDKRGERHRELRLAYEYLKHDIGVDFGDTQGSAARLTHRNDETAEEKQTIERGMPIVKENLTDMMVQEHGLGSSRYSLTIDLADSDRADVVENPENHILFEELRAGRRLLRTHHLERVAGWLDALGHSESEHPEEREQLMKECIDVKERIEAALLKCDELNITDARDEDDVFEEVAVYGSDEDPDARQVAGSDTTATASKQRATPARSALRGLFAPVDFPDIDEDPTYAHASRPSPSHRSAKAQGKQPMETDGAAEEEHAPQAADTSDPHRAALLATAPYVEYGDDIHYWNESEIPINSSGLELSHRFYGTANPDSALSEAGMRHYKLRAVPLSHLVDRPSSGAAAGEQQAEASSSAAAAKNKPSAPARSEAIPLWQQIADDVSRQSGNGPVAANGGQRRRKRSRYDGPGLVDVRASKKTSRERIMERLSDRRMRKVAEEVSGRCSWASRETKEER